MPVYPDTIIYLCERADIIDRFGGADWLTEAADPQRTGSYDTSILDRARADASGDAMAAGGNKAKLWADGTTIPQRIVTLTARRAVVYVWDYGTHGKVRPENVQKIYDETEAAFQALLKGEAGTGPTEPKNRHSLGPIDNSDGGRRMVASSFASSRWR